MCPTLTAALLRATTATFEELALLPTEPAGDWPHDADPHLTSTVNFGGARAGQLALCVSEAALPSIAANMLGQELAESRRIQHDALGELANVICGNIIPDVDETHAGIHITPPRIDGAVARDDSPTAAICLRLDNGAVRALLYVEPVG